MAAEEIRTAILLDFVKKVGDAIDEALADDYDEITETSFFYQLCADLEEAKRLVAEVTPTATAP